MIDFISTYLEPILAFISGGGLVSIFTLKYSKKQAEANAMRAVQEVYQNTIKDLQADKEIMKQDNRELRAQISELQKSVHQNSKDISLLKEFKCIVTDCPKRKRN